MECRDKHEFARDFKIVTTGLTKLDSQSTIENSKFVKDIIVRAAANFQSEVAVDIAKLARGRLQSASIENALHRAAVITATHDEEMAGKIFLELHIPKRIDACRIQIEAIKLAKAAT